MKAQEICLPSENETKISAPPPLRITDYFIQQSARVEQWLDRLLPGANESPTTIHEAMRYSIFAGGKRLRPTLVIATGEVFGAEEQALLPAACALEMIHTYSLIHDDLPAMDNDDLRRGRPTNHKVYGEAMAILAGDALLTQAFITLTKMRGISPENQIRVIAEVAEAAGTIRALIGGQVLDIENEGKPATAEELTAIHRAKTGALIRCCVRVGAIIGGASESELEHFTEYAEKSGLAFQVADDVLDATATSEELGKTAGKDEAAQKATYVSLYGIENARQHAEQLYQEAIAAVRQTGRATERLEAIARFIVERKN
ncbi:MAG: polyprenyl synthetase family protein [Acidobacteria bacterium]|nr:polyprenyl synthetase family protein [Acidobacteriota bacterium]